MDKKKCLKCNTIIIGRTDKKFCSNTCRSRYFRSLDAEFHSHKVKVHEILRKNRDILARFDTSGACIVVPGQLLEDMAFNFNFFTTIYRTKSGSVYWFCYDYGFLKIQKNNSYQLVKWKPYMTKYTLLDK